MTDTTPHRVQRKRTKGWKMPPNTVYVGRPTKWGNPYTVGRTACGCHSAGECDHGMFQRETPEEAVEAYEEWVKCWTNPRGLSGSLQDLRGKNLACFCPLDRPCHADVLLEIANR